MLDLFSKAHRIKLAKQFDSAEQAVPEKSETDQPLYEDLAENLARYQEIAGESNDLIVRNIFLNDKNKTAASLLLIDGMINNTVVIESIMKPLLLIGEEHTVNQEFLKRSLICGNDIKEVETFEQLFAHVFSGDTVVLVDGLKTGVAVSTRGWDKRSISEPETESVVRGPREGFTEDFRTNTALMRRKIKSPRLRLDGMVIGERSKTNICVAYLHDVADPQLVKDIKEYLQSINIDGILESGYLEQFIETSNYSLFATVGITEKPDVAAAKVLEGRVAVIIDGTPFVLTLPMVFAETLQTAEDYYSRTLYACVIRFLHYIALTIATLGPAAFVAFTTYHQEMIPTTLLFTMVKAREGIPFPSFVEAVILLLVFEILREAGLRLPKPAGQAISFVGALVMGEAAVSAGIVGPPMLIAVAITAVASFVVPQLAETVVIVRFALLMLAGALGGYGLMLGLLAMLIHMASLDSFGVPYMSFIAPVFTADSMKDVFIRAPIPKMDRRPKVFAHGDILRQSKNKNQDQRG